jgi:hypothetical protein
VCNFIDTVLSEHWELDSISLVNLINGSENEADHKGLLILTMIDHYTGVKRNGTVCAENFNELSAHVICRSMGYVSAMLESFTGKTNNFTKLVN